VDPVSIRDRRDSSPEYRRELDDTMSFLLDMLSAGRRPFQEIVVIARRRYRQAWRNEIRRRRGD
jgi:hypothetical protein